MLRVDHITKSYGDVRALTDVSFTLEPGEIVGFVGANGAGKTTAMRVIMGGTQPDSGEVSWNGEPMTLAHRRCVGYMPEERGLYPKMPVARQLIYLARLHGLDAAEARQRTDHWMRRLGIQERANDDVQALSLGNQQRVQLAAALLHSPMLLILDEPFSGLDPVAVDVMSSVLRDQADGGVPTLFSSHQLDVVERVCDRIIIIQQGQILTQGTVAELRSHTPARHRVVLAGARRDDVDALAMRWQGSLSTDGDHYIMAMATPRDSSAFLREATQIGTVLEYAPTRPPLTEIFRDVLTHSQEESA